MTKYLTREKVDNAIDKIGQVVQSGRAEASLDIQGKVSIQEDDKEKKQWTTTKVGGSRASAAVLDHWVTEEDKVVRIHSQPRSALFAATAKDLDADSLGPVRTTHMVDRAGNESILHDYWRASRRPQRHQPFQWIGLLLSIRDDSGGPQSRDEVCGRVNTTRDVNMDRELAWSFGVLALLRLGEGP